MIREVRDVGSITRVKAKINVPTIGQHSNGLRYQEPREIKGELLVKMIVDPLMHTFTTNYCSPSTSHEVSTDSFGYGGKIMCRLRDMLADLPASGCGFESLVNTIQIQTSHQRKAGFDHPIWQKRTRSFLKLQIMWKQGLETLWSRHGTDCGSRHLSTATSEDRYLKKLRLQ